MDSGSHLIISAFQATAKIFASEKQREGEGEREREREREGREIWEGGRESEVGHVPLDVRND